jgi:hypothetical protein
MAFGKISQSLAIPVDAIAEYTFHQLRLSPEGPPALRLRHAGDGTPSFKRAQWAAANAARSRNRTSMISEARIKTSMLEEAKLIADHCVVSWSNVVEDETAEPAPCTPEKVIEFLSAIIESHEGITTFAAFRAWAQDPDNFRPAPIGDAAELGKA